MRATLLLAALVTQACVVSDEKKIEGGGEFTVGVERDRMLDSLNLEESAVLCVNLEHVITALVSPDEICEQFAVENSEDEDACFFAKSECLRSDLYETIMGEMSWYFSLEPVPERGYPGCPADFERSFQYKPLSIGDFEDCLNAGIRYTRHLFNYNRCDIVYAESKYPTPTFYDDFSACQAFPSLDAVPEIINYQ